VQQVIHCASSDGKDFAVQRISQCRTTELRECESMLIGAYRDKEVDSSHHLILKLEAIRKAGANVEEVVMRR
jgi:predicted ATPase